MPDNYGDIWERPTGIPSFDALTPEQRREVMAAYDARERERTHAEWAADGSWDHVCGLDDESYRYCGGCSICGVEIPDNAR